MCYCSVTVTAILALWLTHRVKHISSRFLPVQQKSPDRPAAPPPLKWCSDIYPGFLSGSVHFFVFTLLFFFRLLISSLGPGRWWDMILLLPLCYCLQLSLSLDISDQVRADTAPVRGRGIPGAQEWLTRLRHAPWLWLVVLTQERWMSADHITATGWSHRQLTCIWFYCQIMMIVSDITNDSYRLQV